MRRIESAMIGLAAVAAMGLAGCASAAPADTPAWFNQKLATLQHGYPRLQDVPQTTIANTNARHWDEVQSDMTAAQQQLASSPRDVPASGVDPQGFQAQALQELDHTRATHADAGPTTAPAPH